MNFRLWLETDNEVEWRRLFDELLKMYAGWEEPQFHSNMIRLLRNVGLHDEANDLEIVRPSKEDIEYGNTPSGGLGMTVGDVLRHKRDRKKEASFIAARRAYMAELESIADKIEAKGRETGWQWAR